MYILAGYYFRFNRVKVYLNQSNLSHFLDASNGSLISITLRNSKQAILHSADKNKKKKFIHLMLKQLSSKVGTFITWGVPGDHLYPLGLSQRYFWTFKEEMSRPFLCIGWDGYLLYSKNFNVTKYLFLTCGSLRL